MCNSQASYDSLSECDVCSMKKEKFHQNVSLNVRTPYWINATSLRKPDLYGYYRTVWTRHRLRFSGYLVFLIVFYSCFIIKDVLADVFLNQWAVEIYGGPDAAARVAYRHGFRNLGPIGVLENYYLFEHRTVEKRSPAPSRRQYHRLKSNHRVRWLEQQKVKQRFKRDSATDDPIGSQDPGQDKVINDDTWLPELNDPFWPKMWYMHGGRDGGKTRGGVGEGGGAGFNMKVIGAWRRGYTGRGVVVTILDDGIEYNHTDLLNNYDPRASYDINGADVDPMPRYDDADENKHGTRCAGEVAAVANNSKCAIGVAFRARIGGVRMLDGDVTDTVEALALSLNPQHVDIYSASWGPEDNGKVVDGPDRLAVEAFNHGILHGRGGKGSIYVWASGNGGSQSDSCSCDGYTNSIYTLSVSSVSESGVKPWYLEECASTLATTYSSGEYRDKKIMTTDIRNRCTDHHTGTSASAPLAAGICALALEANSNLTWRDMQHLVILTSRTESLKDAQWVTNGVGRQVSHRYGYGMMDAEAMVIAAERWTNVPDQHICLSDKAKLNSDLSGEGAWFEMMIDRCQDSEQPITFLEHVQVILSLDYSRRGDLQIHLHSPAGTRSTLLPARRNDYHKGQFKSWSFLSVFYWGENPSGVWKLHVENVGFELNTGTFEQWQLILYGTAESPVKLKEFPISAPLSAEQLQKLFEPEEPLIKITTPPPTETVPPKHSDETNRNTTEDQDLDGEVLPEGIPRNISHGKPSSSKNRTLDGFTLPVIPVPRPTTRPPGDEDMSEPVVVITEGCHEECTSDGCIDVTAKGCLKCAHARNPQSGECVAVCPPGTYFQPLTSQCETCITPCATCSLVEMDINMQVVSCDTCLTNHNLLSLGLLTVCTDQCPERYYSEESSGWCKECVAQCRDCVESAEYCLECMEGFELIAFTCEPACLHNQYRDLHGKCQECDSSCGACTGSSTRDCSACATDLLWQEGLCVLNCTHGYYSDASALQPSGEERVGHGHRCHACHFSCSSCYGSTQRECYSCLLPYRLIGHTCQEGCPPGQYEGSDGLCHTCHAVCDKCSGPHEYECLSCPSPLYYYEGRCMERCYDGLYYVEVDHMTGHVTHQCEKCYETCETCEGGLPNDCITCPHDKLFSYGQCTNNCSIGEYEEDRRCVRCHDSCRACTGQNADQCVACHEDLYLFNGWCLSECPTGFHPLEGLCRPCPPHCRICADVSRCVVCDDGYATVMGNCVSFAQLCGNGQYYNHSLMGCQPCHTTCSTCDTGASDGCLSCQSNLISAHTTSPANQQSLKKCLRCCDEVSRLLTSPESLECCNCDLQTEVCSEVLTFTPPIFSSTSLSTDQSTTSSSSLATPSITQPANHSSQYSSHSPITSSVTSTSATTTSPGVEFVASVTSSTVSTTTSTTTTTTVRNASIPGVPISSSISSPISSSTYMSSSTTPSISTTPSSRDGSYSSSATVQSSIIPDKESTSELPQDLFFGAPLWLVATVIVLCLSAVFAALFVVVFCLVQAKSGHKLCWAKHRYNLIYMHQRNGTNGNSASGRAAKSSGEMSGVLLDGKYVKNGRHDIELTSVRV